MVKPYLNQVGGKVENDVNLFSGGLNVYTDKAFVDANHMPYVMNMTMKNPPKMETRNPRQTLAWKLENHRYPLDPDIVNSVVDIWTYDEHQFYVIVRNGNKVNIVQYKRPYVNGFYMHDFVSTVVSEIADEPNYYFTLARTGKRDYLYITGMTFKYKICMNPSDDEIASDNWRWNIQDGHYGICCWHKGRLFLANPGSEYGNPLNPVSNIITFSALNDFENFDEGEIYQVTTATPSVNVPNLNKDYIYLVSDGGGNYTEYQWNGSTWSSIGTIADYEIDLDSNGMSMPDYSIIAGDFKVTNSKGKIVSLKSFDDKLIIFCEHTIHALYGDTPDIEMQNQFQLVDINNNLGALLDRCVTVGGGRLFFLGDDHEVYEYTGSALNIITRPGTTRNSTISVGGISGLIEAKDIFEGMPVDMGDSYSKFVATAEKLYINIWNRKRTDEEKLLFVFDIYNRLWWCEDGDFNTIGNFSDYNNKILLARGEDLLINNQEKNLAWNEDRQEYSEMYDEVYDFSTNSIVNIPIEYEIHTRVYGADGLDMRKSISEVWLQARARAQVYLNDVWSSADAWSVAGEVSSNLIKIGDLVYLRQNATQPIYYRPVTYEQQVCYVEKMYGERLNAFQIIIKGTGDALFWLMKRVWRAR